MKTVVMIMGLLLLGAMAYIAYNYSIEKRLDISINNSSDEAVAKVKSVVTEVVVDEESIEDKVETDIAVKSSIVEEIPDEEVEEVPIEEQMLESEQEDIIEYGDSEDKNLSENIEDIIEEQEALINEAEKEEMLIRHGEAIKEQEAYLDKEFDDEGRKEVPILQAEEKKILSEEDRIIEEEEAARKAAMKDNISE